MKNWVFYSIYVPTFNYLEHSIEGIVIPTVEKVKSNFVIHQWFFIRYVDMQGPHIRLRFLIDEKDMECLEEVMDEVIEKKLAALISKPPLPLSRLLRLPPQEKEFEASFDQEEYEPEYEKYGGIQGVKIAEQCFELSSELVINFTNSSNFTDKDRFDLSLLLMKITAKQAKLSKIEEHELWERILSYWSGSTYNEDDRFKNNLIEAAKKRLDVLGRKLEAISQKTSMIQLVNDYEMGLGNAFSSMTKSEKIVVTKEHLAFHYIHMMNNRLGVTPIEEAYLGALLLNGDKVSVK
ncbi:thiopeptide-type bacteriocin biosynthesis protein [Oceanobacillus sp. M65]|uniref:thiopeptide-type bacteriocin biosynthesis protein n=1 Tax=Oceanobacillus sp. M65 TaxID=3457435 RepID=UPI003FCCD4D3